ncbi:MAG: hypothetical protein ACJ746_21660 [Bryobacteraceae bacterium]
MESRKTVMRDLKSNPDSAGDRRAGSVGERPELAGSRDNEDRSARSKRKRADIDVNSADPILDGTE